MEFNNTITDHLPLNTWIWAIFTASHYPQLVKTNSTGDKVLTKLGFMPPPPFWAVANQQQGEDEWDNWQLLSLPPK
jgi:thioredoxin-related protein